MPGGGFSRQGGRKETRVAFKVCIPQDISNAGKDFLKERGYDLAVGSGSFDVDVLKREVAEADAILARAAPFPREVLSAAPNLRVIARHGVGYNNIDVDYCTENGIWITYAPRSNVVSVAEHAIALMLALAHNMMTCDRLVREGDWGVRDRLLGVDLAEKTLGLIGLGRIGRLVSEKAMAGFGMRVIGHDPLISAGEYPAGVEPETLEGVFARADFVSLHVPAVVATEKMVNAALLAKMKPTAYLVNCARGEVVDEAALYQALAERRIAGAGLDVFAVEPAGGDNPLFRLDNVVVSPHNAALTVESMDRMGLHAAMGIHSVLAGEVPEWPVNDPRT